MAAFQGTRPADLGVGWQNRSGEHPCPGLLIDAHRGLDGWSCFAVVISVIGDIGISNDESSAVAVGRFIVFVLVIGGGTYVAFSAAMAYGERKPKDAEHDKP